MIRMLGWSQGFSKFAQSTLKGVHAGQLNRITIAKIHGRVLSPVVVLAKPTPCTFTILPRLMSKTPSFTATRGILARQKKDGVPQSFELIYRTDLPTYFVLAQIVVVGAVLLVVIAGVFYASSDNTPADVDKESDDTSPLEKLRKDLGVENEGPMWKIRPAIDDITGDDPDALYLLAGVTISLLFSLFTILRRFPARIYTAKSGHCLSVHYSSIIPGRVKLKQFNAGTLRPGSPNSKLFLANVHHKDPEGRSYYLMEDYFRQPADYMSLLDDSFQMH